jgi:hypothetical protein
VGMLLELPLDPLDSMTCRSLKSNDLPHLNGPLSSQ